MDSLTTLNHLKKDYANLTQDDLIATEGGNFPFIIPVPVVLPMKMAKWASSWFK